jgi:myo-inositol-1-phosphate synthase
VRDRRRRRLRQRAAGLHRLRPEWAAKFEAAGVPIIGDDIKSQVGATITHRVMAKLFEDRGVVLDRTYQLNVGGNMDFKNMLERERLESKKVSKTQAVTSNLTGPLAGKKEDRNVHIGPSDYVAWLDDRKWAYVRLEGRAFGDVPLNLEYKLEVWDSPELRGHHHRRGPRGEDRQGSRHRRRRCSPPAPT